MTSRLGFFSTFFLFSFLSVFEKSGFDRPKVGNAKKCNFSLHECFYSVVVSTLDFESSNASSNLARSAHFFSTGEVHDAAE